MSTTEETFSPATLHRTDTISSTITVPKPSNNSSTKTSRPSQSHPRIDFEPLYSDLKALIGHHWAVYHDALTRFIRGELSNSEFSDLTDNFLLATPATEHAHNVLICAIVHNTVRDLPDPGPAAWVSAALDKAAAASSVKPAITSDAAEQRIKTEVMRLPNRERRRLKAIVGDKVEEDITVLRRNGYDEYFQASRIRAPDNTPASAGGLTKTNWELEIKKRYAQPLFIETVEFPDAANIYARMVPICYEESVSSGSSIQCAELVSIAAEIYVKDLLSGVFNRTRANGPRFENTGGGGVLTGAYKQQIAKEEAGVRDGKIQRNRENELLPIESREANIRRPVGMGDLKLASAVVRGLWNGMPVIGTQVAEAPLEAEQEEWRTERALAEAVHAALNGGVTNGEVDEMDVDDEDYGWEGTGAADKEVLGSLLEDCLAIRA